MGPIARDIIYNKKTVFFSCWRNRLFLEETFLPRFKKSLPLHILHTVLRFSRSSNTRLLHTSITYPTTIQFLGATRVDPHDILPQTITDRDIAEDGDYSSYIVAYGKRLNPRNLLHPNCYIATMFAQPHTFWCHPPNKLHPCRRSPNINIATI